MTRSGELALLQGGSNMYRHRLSSTHIGCFAVFGTYVLMRQLGELTALSVLPGRCQMLNVHVCQR
jgi:hypothetical protein